MERDLDSMLQDRMIEQRRIMVSGPLDNLGAMNLAAQLMTLDGASNEDIDLMVSSPGGPLVDVLPILDVLGLMRARVNVTAIGAVAGTATAVLAVGPGIRQAAPHATISLRLDRSHVSRHGSALATAEDLARQADELASLRARYVGLIATATGRDEVHIEMELEAGQRHSAVEAMGLGIIDAVFDRSSGTNQNAGDPAQQKAPDE